MESYVTDGDRDSKDTYEIASIHDECHQYCHLWKNGLAYDLDMIAEWNSIDNATLPLIDWSSAAQIAVVPQVNCWLLFFLRLVQLTLYDCWAWY